MKKDDKIYLGHIFECIELIEKYTKGVSKEKFLYNIPIQNIVIRQLEIIGEGAKIISSKLRQKYPDVPWSKMAKTRDKLIHHYFDIDLKLAYKISQQDIPKLKNQIQEILKDRLS